MISIDDDVTMPRRHDSDDIIGIQQIAWRQLSHLAQIDSAVNEILPRLRIPLPVIDTANQRLLAQQLTGTAVENLVALLRIQPEPIGVARIPMQRVQRL